MTRKKSFVAFISFIALLATMSAATADMSMDAGAIIQPGTLNPYEYGKAPEGVYAFIYYDSAPYPALNADTSNCETDRL